jgi:hypothetical protein
MSCFSTGGRALGPLLAALACAVAGSYAWALGGLAGLLAVSAALVLAPWRLFASGPHAAAAGRKIAS